MTSYNLNRNHGYVYEVGLMGPLATLVVMFRDWGCKIMEIGINLPFRATFFES
jgi:hypothetical protein